MEHSTKRGDGQIFLAVHKEQEDTQSSASSIEGKTTDPQKPHEHVRTRNRRHRASSIEARPPTHKNHMSTIGRATVSFGIEARPPTHKNHMSTIGRADQSQKTHVTKNHKTTHTRTTKDPQRPKTRKVACRAGLQSIRHAKTTKTTRTTEPCGSSHACGYLGGYSPYFYIILYI